MNFHSMAIHLYQLINVNVNIYRDDEAILIACLFHHGRMMKYKSRELVIKAKRNEYICINLYSNKLCKHC